MEQQFTNRLTQVSHYPQQQHQPQQHPHQQQQQQQHNIYSSPPYNVFSSQQHYLTSPYQQTSQHQQQYSFQQSSASYCNRPTVSSASVSAINMQARRGGGGAAGSTSTGALGGRPSSHPSAVGGAAAVHHHQQYSSGVNGSGDGPYMFAAGAAIHHPPVVPLQPHRTMGSQDMPLRIVVDAKYVGAIIGQGGSNIREITKESKARCVVDVQRAVRDPGGNHEKVISILGQPESCSRACMKILEVVRREMVKDNSISQHQEIELKMRAHNQLVGRLIGKGGATIKKIMEETGANIYVSNDPPMGRDVMGVLPPYSGPPSLLAADMAMQLERTITVKGNDMSVIAAAEQRISQKLRQSYEADLNGRVLYPSPSNMVPLMTPLCGETGSYVTSTPPSHISRTSTVNSSSAAAVVFAAQQPRVVRMWVPNSMVGALIGAKGVHIRNVMRMTGAHVKIEGGGERATGKEKKEKVESKEIKEASKECGETTETTSESAASASAAVAADSATDETQNSELGASPNLKEKKNFSDEGNKESRTEKETTAAKSTDKEKDVHIEERLVLITGNDPQQYKAQFWIYQRIAEQSYHYLDEVRLCTEIAVPNKLVGRIIGKGGQNVRDLQRITGAQVKIPDDAGEDESQEITNVRIIGNFQASQAVQARLGQLIQDYARRSFSVNGAPTQGPSPSAHEKATSIGAQPQATHA